MPAHTVTQTLQEYPSFCKVLLPVEADFSAHSNPDQVVNLRYETVGALSSLLKGWSPLEFGSFKLLCIYYSLVTLKKSMILSLFGVFSCWWWSFATSCILTFRNSSNICNYFENSCLSSQSVRIMKAWYVCFVQWSTSRAWYIVGAQVYRWGLVLGSGATGWVRKAQSSSCASLRGEPGSEHIYFFNLEMTVNT